MSMIPFEQCITKMHGSISDCLNVKCDRSLTVVRKSVCVVCHTFPACFSPSRHLCIRHTVFCIVAPGKFPATSMPGICSQYNSTSIGFRVKAFVTSPWASCNPRRRTMQKNNLHEVAEGVAQYVALKSPGPWRNPMPTQRARNSSMALVITSRLRAWATLVLTTLLLVGLRTYENALFAIFAARSRW